MPPSILIPVLFRAVDCLRSEPATHSARIVCCFPSTPSIVAVAPVESTMDLETGSALDVAATLAELVPEDLLVLGL